MDRGNNQRNNAHHGKHFAKNAVALVIDTSYSTSGELVRAFLAETYTLLKGRENFFHRMNLHLIQADNAIRQDLLILSLIHI